MKLKPTNMKWGTSVPPSIDLEGLWNVLKEHKFLMLTLQSELYKSGQNHFELSVHNVHIEYVPLWDALRTDWFAIIG